jgi:sister-chromatid-cohesion protein PDS5
MADAYDFAEHDGEDLGRAVTKLRSNLKSRDVVLKHLKLAAGVIEKAPQDVAALGSAGAGLAALLINKNILGSKHKDVRMYAAVCLAHMLRIYAPETPYEDKELEVGSRQQHSHGTACMPRMKCKH